MGKLLSYVGSNGRPGTGEVEPPAQFIGQKREVQRLAMGQDLSQELMGKRRPGGPVIAAGAFESEIILVPQPLVSQLVETTAADQEPFSGSFGIELAAVESFKDLLNE